MNVENITTVAKLQDNSLQGQPLLNDNLINIVQDCDGNYIVSEEQMELILEAYPGTSYELIPYCKFVDPEIPED